MFSTVRATVRVTACALTLIAFALMTNDANARGFRVFSSRTVSRTVSVSKYSSPSAAVADKAARCASSCRMAHLGGGYGGGNAEGVGCAGTAAVALSNCCFTGKRVCIASAVRQGRNGLWYAVKIFR